MGEQKIYPEDREGHKAYLPAGKPIFGLASLLRDLCALCA
jgi:hypothetical protein